MAGIGFELRRVVDKKGLGSFFQIALSGAIIVAGPWLLSIITISLLRILAGRLIGSGMDLFMGVVIYCYAFSLFLFGGFHYLFTRRMSDLLYLKKEGEAFGYVLLLCIPVALISAAIALPAAALLPGEMEYPAVFKFSAVLFFMTVNCLWIVMLFVSVLKWYIKIMIVYAAGFGSALASVIFLAGRWGTSGAMLGFTAGHLLIVVLLILLCRAAWKPSPPSPPEDLLRASAGNKSGGPVLQFIRYLKLHRYLFGAGLLYYWGIWSDKIILWFTAGEKVGGSFIRLFEVYDIPVFLANLTMIPGLVFFIIWSETEFYTALKNLLLKIARSRYADIAAAKQKLAAVSGRSIKEQSLLQAVVSIAIVLIVDDPVLKTVTVAVFFHLLLLTLMNYLFYIEQYRHSFYSAAVFFTVNTAAAVISTLLPGVLQPGYSYVAGAASAALTAGILLKHDILKLERHILTKN